ncbi:MAG TPA: malto-oligosyltrehalose synthase [Steroidobacteraceae bacterium]|nr:malto-oligosyltrehalose synthase [Steroidobacteraceae bacterium]
MNGTTATPQQDPRQPRVTPRATYRLQLHREFTFRDAAAIVPYLARLGVIHLYLSPILKARAGSQHGYDVVDHGQLNPELGGEAEFDALVEAAHARGLGLILDVVPNHMAIFGDDNAWWLDVLENGPAARYARYFDIDWRPFRASMRDRLLVPVLGEPIGTVLERGELAVTFDAEAGEFSIRYYEHRFPIDPREYPRILSEDPSRLEAMLPADHPDRQDFESLVAAFGRLPPRSDASDESRSERYRDAEVNKRRLVRLCERSGPVCEHIEACLDAFNGDGSGPRDPAGLAALLDAQAYRLSYWRVAVDEINYRRFFDINGLAALRMDDAEVFEATHALILGWIERGAIDGLRIDHPDGLYDPVEYFDRLQRRFRTEPHDVSIPLYVVAEKILASHERLQETWAVHGTTGYEFAALATAWLVDGTAEHAFDRAYASFTGNTIRLAAIEHDAKRGVMQTSLAAEVGVLATQLDRIAQLDLRTADFTRNALREAIIEVIANFPVYRTYVSDRGASEDDRRHVEWAINVARKHSGAGDLTVFGFLRDVLLGDAAEGRPESHRRAMLEFAMKFQQVTSPVMAKSVEDTALYIYNRLAALNEVGGNPDRFGATTTALHQANLERARRWPHSMLLATSHDTKRSGDVRARLAALSEAPREWRKHLGRWSRLNRARRSQVDGRPAPSRNDEYLLYQTLLGIWPSDALDGPVPDDLQGRLEQYAIKAAREAKVDTSWMNPNEAYETALVEFVGRLLDRPAHNAFLRDFRSLARQVAWFGTMNALSQTILKLTAPGVPDVYQGTEFNELSLVDPDNRRPVDYPARQASLATIERTAASEGLGTCARLLLERWQDGTLKQFVIWRCLKRRAEDPDLFALGDYEPLKTNGSRADHLCAFRRILEGRALTVVVPRWFQALTDGRTRPALGRDVWGDTRIELPSGARTDDAVSLFTGEIVPVHADGEARWIEAADVFTDFPVAVLAQSGES